jgi:sulfur carrier protein
MNTAAASLTIRVNDQPRRLAGATSLLALVRELGLAERKGVAVAVNDGVVPRSQWEKQLLADGDRVLVIQATQGG